ncbi:MAG: CBS domain-containing protein [Proteobacteria bacterium]|nr:CBS domain-containing protein [Pseudomonadota bacterium]MBW3617275.1 CBS domain-containing protein [Pseudomonadota bacterium]
MLVSQILNAKGRKVLTAAPDDTLAEVAERLEAERVGALLVMQDDQVAGIISERDIVIALARSGGAALQTPVSRCMTAEVIAATPTETVDALLARMTNRRVRHLPVLDGGTVCGMVSIGDLVKHKISEVEAEAETLKAYIAAG